MSRGFTGITPNTYGCSTSQGFANAVGLISGFKPANQTPLYNNTFSSYVPSQQNVQLMRDERIAEAKAGGAIINYQEVHGSLIPWAKYPDGREVGLL